MKTEQEIKEKINFTKEFTLASGAIAALELVLQKTQQLGKTRELKVKEAQNENSNQSR